jgi:hypothetical protein
MFSKSRGTLLLTMALASAPSLAARSVNELKEADPRGSIQVNAVSGSIEVLGWDKSQVQVSGTLASETDSVEISGDAAHLAVQVRTARMGLMRGGSDDVRLTIHVPAASAVTLTLVSADFKTAGVTGDLELHTVSGDSKGQVGGNLRVNSVSGDIRLAAPMAKMLAVKTVSGDVEVTGGDGDSEISTVSGTGHITLGTQSHVHFKSTSGDMHLKLDMARDGMLEGEALSGDVSLMFHDAPAADFDVETHSGDIDNCFGPKPAESSYGSGQRLVFKNGDARARVRIATHSGDVELCAQNKGPHP